ncbi:hypothetical protein KQI38_10740 [Tissierella carlieri]|uniref:Uncharacterized protein n=1 Tax=Tissierella carlieri TaxID=689904 RepID=A0ABT1S8V3_9FIRM|nr:hypothetical protein [Tissierella carlieri]MBU5312509.1 hypothetical protein [Tissierella carlieri]MCQ4922898.1 hypothetical protein [Tissierella carlieri]
MNKKSYVSILVVIITYIITRIVYKLTGFSYSFSEGILNIKLLIDLGLWIIVAVLVSTALNKILSNI